MPGPLHGLTIVEFAGIGPGPFAAMMLADHGAEVIRIDRPGGKSLFGGKDVLSRSRRSIALDLKQPAGVAVAKRLCASADGLIEGLRPGVMERLGLGPDALLAANPKLVYGRMTGWGQHGPYAHTAGHDINYIALAGALAHFGRPGENPLPPINLVGDFGGGGMMLAFAMVSAMLHVQRGGPGQVIDCAMTDGTALLMAIVHGMRSAGQWRDERGTNLLDGGAPFYDCYQCACGGYVALGAIEPQFYAELLRLTGLADDPDFARQMDPRQWPALKARLAEVFRGKTRDEWCAILEGSDACFAPVLTMGEAPQHPHNAARGTFIEVGGDIQPAPAPRYSVTASDAPTPERTPGADTIEILAGIGMGEDEIARLHSSGAIA
ncbi:MAG: CoA transferase [Sphingomonadales bacterium]|nr:CoA transferase [Sphingomonadales bacterium]MBD3772688.1 CoA transferase [Paracoccaceae bacterium]